MTNPVDISNEEYRIYTYPNNSEYRINSPLALHVIQDGKGPTHRVTDNFGMTHLPERGWVAIAWKPRDGAQVLVP
ncbi:hypothetical protein ABIC16_002297 [Sphingomonas sp. PvP055]|uniref:hypothetical protein n=1 Tax=Sphingomonas sp. PvP055 TaxID=3156391 RepID=UPI0033979FC1